MVRRPELLAMLEQSGLSADEKDALAQVLSGAGKNAEVEEQS
jgi:hypothetical protein